MARIYRLRRNFDDTVEQCKDTQQSDVFTEYMLQLKRKKETRQTNTIQIENRMGRVLMIGAGGVATVADTRLYRMLIPSASLSLPAAARKSAMRSSAHCAKKDMDNPYRQHRWMPTTWSS